MKIRNLLLPLADKAANPWFRALPDFQNRPTWLVDSRLSLYRRDAQQWCLLIEVVQVDPSSYGHLGIKTILYFVSQPPGEVEPLSGRNFLNLTADGADGKTFSTPRRGKQFVNPHAKSIRVRAKELKLPPKRLYASYGVELFSLPKIERHELARCLVAAHPGCFFANSQEIKASTGLSLGRPILRLKEWRHPKILDGELPSQTETFQMLSDVLVSGDTRRWQPKEEPNTHWTNWPDCDPV
jgi:hypothetical protein